MSAVPGLAEGRALADRWCELNGFPPVVVRVWEKAKWLFPQACAYWRLDVIEICPAICARPGYAGRSWSWPGYAVDRTPYGVVQHELGHRVDYSRGDPNARDRYRSNFSREMRARVGEPPLTGYAPDDGEWFAEAFRLFVTNPALLEATRPGTYAALRAAGFTPVVETGWRETLAANGAPERHLRAAAGRVARAPRELRATRQRSLL